ncbi:GGACT domain-containing protein [Haematococcus lacustris]|uniref:Putative gamma-glutamylcyclotransferase n=1 Tax=Haematococcus lacustris TaxID=44745 RepID=A0A699YU55_HAELA|nr:GGACT domain-containing protein [Haematococcus lacustris]
MPGNAFVYGTLMCEDVLTRLLRQVPVMQPAALQGYTRYKVQGAVYPAILPTNSAAKVEGQVLFELSEGELNILDQYESYEYERRSVSPRLEVRCLAPGL